MSKRMLLAGFVALTVVMARCETEKGFFFRDNDSVVFLGDSITQQKLYTTYLEAYALTRFPDRRFRFRNVGWGGDTAWLRKRFKTDEKALFSATGALLDEMVEKAVRAGLERDVLPHKPTAVTVKFGMNDHAYQAFREDICRAYTRSQTEIVKILKDQGARVALLTPQPIEDKPPAAHDKNVKNQSLRKFSDALREVAAANGAVYVDQFAPYMKIMLDARAAKPDAMIGGGDAVHPGPAGHTLMAWTILKQLNAPALVSECGIDLSRWFFLGKVVCEKNCEISNFKVKGGKISFDRLDHALPMPVDAKATAALALAPVSEELNRYMLKVAGLKEASYALSIDGLKVGKYSREQLAEGVNLATASTPNSAQATQVLGLVFKKNNVYFERWRKVQLGNGPAEKLAELDRIITDLEAQIDTARKPRRQRFELNPL
ncbi:MAG: SGNH/GDSL hydrolase family protein [Kiritimatiellae bacterium]|nr:SGNH/GDSL hydrolase family protein [Kiritimatiellia bacterium]